MATNSRAICLKLPSGELQKLPSVDRCRQKAAFRESARCPKGHMAARIRSRRHEGQPGNFFLDACQRNREWRKELLGSLGALDCGAVLAKCEREWQEGLFDTSSARREAERAIRLPVESLAEIARSMDSTFSLSEASSAWREAERAIHLPIESLAETAKSFASTFSLADAFPDLLSPGRVLEEAIRRGIYERLSEWVKRRRAQRIAFERTLDEALEREEEVIARCEAMDKSTKASGDSLKPYIIEKWFELQGKGVPEHNRAGIIANTYKCAPRYVRRVLEESGLRKKSGHLAS